MRLVSGKVATEDSPIDSDLRPRRLTEFIGQEKLKRAFREMIINTHMLQKGIKTTEIIAVAKHKIFGPLYKVYLFSKEIPECYRFNHLF